MRHILLAITLLFSTMALNATTYTSQAPGIYSDGSSWVGGVAPSPTDDVIIMHDIEVNVFSSVNNVTILSGGKLRLSRLFFVNGDMDIEVTTHLMVYTQELISSTSLGKQLMVRA